jgi:hypothetical protein
LGYIYISSIINIDYYCYYYLIYYLDLVKLFWSLEVIRRIPLRCKLGDPKLDGPGTLRRARVMEIAEIINSGTSHGQRCPEGI